MLLEIPLCIVITGLSLLSWWYYNIWSENSTSHMNAPPALEPDHDLWREVWLHNCMQPMQPDYLEGQTGENPGSAARLYRRKLKLK